MDLLYKLSSEFLHRLESSFERRLPDGREFDASCTILLGQRGVGKTTRVLQYLKKEERLNPGKGTVLYVPCDHYHFQGHTIYEIAEMFHLNSGQIIAFDEIHRYLDWSKELKSTIDSFPDLKIIGTGSSLMEIEKGSHDLSRRAISIEMLGLSFREFLELTGCLQMPPIDLSKLLSDHTILAENVVAKLSKKKKKVIPLFHEYLTKGFYPYFNNHVHLSDFYLTLQQNIDRTLSTDLLAIHPNLSGKAIRKMQTLIARLAIHAPFTPDIRKLATDLGIGDERTLYDYLYYLEGLRLIKMLRNKGSLNTEMNKPEKIFLDNPTLMQSLSQNQSVNTGIFRETFFFCMTSAIADIHAPMKGDFLINNRIAVEVGGKNKSFEQLKPFEDAYLALDNIEVGHQRKIPLWLFGFLY